MTGELVDLSDTLRHDYSRPRCAVCGQLAGRAPDRSWRFACVYWTGDGWEHR